MAESALAFLVNQLSTLLFREGQHLGELRRDIQYIKDELGSMRAFLKDVESKEDADFELHEWIKQVRQLAYDTEDVLDEFTFHFARYHGHGFYGRFLKIYTSVKNWRKSHRISAQIQDIKSRVENIALRHQRYYQSLYATVSERSPISPPAVNMKYDIRGHGLLLEESNLVGIREPKNELVFHVLDDDSHLKVISVVGMGGLGKTTLVKRVYEEVKICFQTRAWVTISQRFQLKDLLKKVIQQLLQEICEPVPPEVELFDTDELKAFIKGFLRDKKFLIVLDDVWNIESWDAIKYVLPDGGYGCRVMLTTRIADIASSSCKEFNGYVHRMQPLSAAKSWTLFCRKAFQDNLCPPHLENVSRSILSKCEGLPLAIVAIGGLLALKDRRKVDEWEMVLGSIGDELEGGSSTGKLDRVKKILLLSYNELPFYLKSCLLYTSIYPEDYQIYGWALVRLWAAEGFVQEREGMTSVQVAEMYLDELVNRSLIQVVETKVDGSIEDCRIHDILREIILSKSRQSNITTIVANGNGISRRGSELDDARRLAIHGFIENHQENLPSNHKHLRTIIIFGTISPLTTSSVSRLLLRPQPKLLKVLDLAGAEFKNIPEEVFHLYHLKYLNLGGSRVETIPKSIGKLKNLEFLILLATDVKELPSEILKLQKLRDLRACQIGGYSKNYAVSGFKAPNEIGKLLSLEYLHFVDSDNTEMIKQIGKLTQLRDVGITKLRRQDGKELCSSLENLTNLRGLRVYSIKDDEILDLQYPISPVPGLLQELVLKGVLEKLPPWIHSLQGLTTLALMWSEMKEEDDDPLQPIQDLPNLSYLILHQAFVGEKLCFKSGKFKALKMLELRKMKGLKSVMVEKGAMPHLHEMQIAACDLLQGLPQGIENLTKLQSLLMYDMDNPSLFNIFTS